MHPLYQGKLHEKIQTTRGSNIFAHTHTHISKWPELSHLAFETVTMSPQLTSLPQSDAIDPAPPSYGAPFTLAQAQQHISNSPVGSRITWHQAAPEGFLLASTNAKTWDVAVLAHCIWYFPSKSTLRRILHSLRGKVHRLCIAEYALHASSTAAVPHVLAALARGMLESHKVVSDENIRSPLSPRQMVEVAAEAGWVVGGESDMLVPELGLLDGHWEVGTVVSKHFVDEIEELQVDERVRDVLRSARDSAVAAVQMLRGDKIRTMDVWVGTLVPASQ